jgi:uncharacterized membrane protein YvbJ
MSSLFCPNCGLSKKEDGRVCCKKCRDAFPGDPKALEMMEDDFLKVKEMIGVFDLINGPKKR